jgi:hypothetical protein
LQINEQTISRDNTILKAVLTGAYVAIANEEFAGTSGVPVPKAQNHFLE